jgi:amidohydrolase
MDALPITEKTGLPFTSENPGVMHACGHDSHTSMLLGVAHLLRQSYVEEPWHGNVRLLFQPSEESFDKDDISGAMAMIADGALDGVDYAIALHISGPLALGKAYFQDGYAWAASDTFEAWIQGAGGHAAAPHLANDPLWMLSQVLPAIYAIPSRRINALQSAVVSVGQVHAGTASNVIPERVYLEGTMRSYDAEVRAQLRTALEDALRLVEPLGGSYELKLRPWFAALYNDPEVNGWLRSVSADILGAENVVERQFGMGSEDFAFMVERVPGAMFVLGAATDDGIKRSHHTDTFTIDERALPFGAAILADTARRVVTGSLR